MGKKSDSQIILTIKFSLDDLLYYVLCILIYQTFFQLSKQMPTFAELIINPFFDYMIDLLVKRERFRIYVNAGREYVAQRRFLECDDQNHASRRTLSFSQQRVAHVRNTLRRAGILSVLRRYSISHRG